MSHSALLGRAELVAKCLTLQLMIAVVVYKETELYLRIKVFCCMLS